MSLAVRAYNIDFARWVLVNHGDIGRQLLSSLLFLLDALSFLRDHGDRRASGSDEAEGAGQRWADWLAYIREAYCAASVPSTSQSGWTSPFALPASICEPLQLWLSSSTSLTAIFPGKEREAVANASRAAIAYILSQRDALQDYEQTHTRTSGEASIEDQYEALLAESADAPLPLDWSMVGSIRTAIADARQSAGDDHSVMLRWALSTILEQHYGASDFGQKSDALGRVFYAAKAADDAAIRDFFAPSDGTGSIGDVEESSTSHGSSAAAMRQASEAIRRKDAAAHAAIDKKSHRVTASEPVNSLSAAHGPTRRYSAWEDASNTTDVSAYSSRSGAPLWPHSRIYAFPESPDLDETDRPFSDCIAVQTDAPPPTSNALSSGQRRDLVRRSRKLQSMLGATLDEEAAQKALVSALKTDDDEPEGTSRLKRRSSDPLPSPTDLAGRRGSVATLRQKKASPTVPIDAMSSPETPYARDSDDDDDMGSTTDFTSPEMDLQTPNDYETQIPWGRAFIQSLEADARARDERRRRVAKLQRVLGERVPAELIFAPSPIPAEAPRKAPSKLENAISRFGLRSKSMTRNMTDESSGRSSDESDRPPFEAARPAGMVPKLHSTSASHALTPEQTLASIRKARKLEQLFGQMPPSTLYERPRFVRPVASFGSDDEIDVPKSLKRRSSASVKALLHLHDNDPETLDNVVQTLADDEKPSKVGETPDLSLSPDTFTSRAAVDTQRHFARASKLARIFGTTRGEVLKRVLEDLEADLEEDDPVSDGEREEVLMGIRRLRREAL